MGVELALVLVLALVSVAAALWLVHRAIRGTGRRHREPTHRIPAAPPATSMATGDEEHSKGIVPAAAPPAEANATGRKTRPMVAVGPGFDGAGTSVPQQLAIPAALASAARPSTGLTSNGARVGPGAPSGLDVRSARADDIHPPGDHGQAPITPPAQPSAAGPAPAPSSTAHAPQGMPTPGNALSRPVDTTSVCPYLGIFDHPTTRFDFPHPANACHSTSALRPEHRARRGLRPFAHPRAMRLPLEYQAMLCLEAVHERCPRYLAASAAETPPDARAGDDEHPRGA